MYYEISSAAIKKNQEIKKVTEYHSNNSKKDERNKETKGS